MNSIQLNSTFKFSVEPYNGKLRFVIMENGLEYVYRIERKKAIETFLLTDSASIFKGRLQLHKYDNDISVEVKGEVVGSIVLSSFKQMLSLT